MQRISFHARDLPKPSIVRICKQLIEELYIEPKEKSVLGFFPTPVQ